MTVRFIDSKTLLALASLRGLNPGRVLYRMHEYYCKPMYARGKCDYNCAVTCKKNIGRIFREFKKAGDEEALLVWRMRDATANTMEEKKEVKVEQNIFGEPKFDNVFEFLAEELNEVEAQKS